MRQQTGLRAFTLVELLVVILVLAILAAVAWPKVVNHFSATGDATAKQNLQLIRDAMDSYQVEYGGHPNAVRCDRFGLAARRTRRSAWAPFIVGRRRTNVATDGAVSFSSWLKWRGWFQY